jgi:hypothetical protein
VTINNFGVLDLNDKNETIANLTINGGRVGAGSETFIVNGSLAQNSGTYDARGQQLIAGSIQVGVNGTSRFIQPPSLSSRVTCNGDLRVGSGAAGNGEYTLQSGSLTVAGSLVVGSPGTGVFRQSGGAATFATVLNHGTVEFSGGAASGGALDGSGSLIVSGTGSLTVNRIRQGRLTITGTHPRVTIRPSGADSATSRVDTIDLGTPARTAITGTLDVTNNALVVDYDTANPFPDIRQYINSARNGGAWNGFGITSSAAAAHPTHSTTLGVMESADYLAIYGAGTPFEGQAIDSTAVLVKYTYYGDTDFNGKVNFDDYVRTDNGFNNHLPGWVNGDFDLNGQVNFDDYVLIDLAFNTQSGTLGRALSFLDGSDPGFRGMDNAALQMVQAHFAEFGADYAQHFLAAVPEPALVALGGVATSVGMVGRRRYRR